MANPTPMMSMFAADCIARGVDMAAGGARYNHKTLSFVGFGTLCDSLLSLRAAYEDGSIDALLEAVKTDFADCEVYHLRLQSSDNRFGHSDAANAFAASLAESLAHVTDGIVNGCGIPWGTSLFTYYQYSHFGHGTGATPDGRHAGEIFSGQMNMASPPSLTEAARAMAHLTKADFHDVGMFDIALPVSVTDSTQSVDALAAFIAACLELKIPVLQPNVADKKTMIEERDNPGTHPDLVVRICGYSAMFATQSRSVQDELIARTNL
jgi:formate C-acetyltransferase